MPKTRFQSALENQVRNTKTDTFKKENAAFLNSGTSGAELARSPQLFPKTAMLLQMDINRDLKRDGTVRQKSASFNTFPGASFAFDFHTAQQELRREFVNVEVERRFGPQDVLSRSSTVGPDGVRRPVPGQGTSASLTDTQREEISSSFVSPLQRIVLPNSVSGITPPTPSVIGPRNPTIISGAGIRRRRPRGGTSESTILTSDASGSVAPSGGRTLLG